MQYQYSRTFLQMIFRRYIVTKLDYRNLDTKNKYEWTKELMNEWMIG